MKLNLLRCGRSVLGMRAPALPRSELHTSPLCSAPNLLSLSRQLRSLHCLQAAPPTVLSTAISCQFLVQKSQIYTVSGLASTLWQHLKFTGGLKQRKYVLRTSALRLYLCCVELVDHDAFIREFSFPDTLTSWFRVAELHLWLCYVRLAQEGREGQVLRNFIMEYFWEDLDKKTKKLGPMMSWQVRNEGIQILSQEFKSALYAYDEGLQGDDRVLAGALWRNFFCRASDVDVQQLDTMVQYVRKQVVHLDEMDGGVIQSAGLFTFLPLRNTPDAVERNKLVLLEIAKRV